MLGGLGFSLLAAIIRVFGGMLSERIGGERTAVLAFVAVLIGALILTFVDGFLSSSRRRIADRARHGRRQCGGIQDGAEICAGGGRRRGRSRRRPGRARRLHHPAVPWRRRRCARKQGYAGGFFAYVVLAVVAVGVSAYFWHLDRGSKSTTAVTPAILEVR